MGDSMNLNNNQNNYTRDIAKEQIKKESKVQNEVETAGTIALYEPAETAGTIASSGGDSASSGSGNFSAMA